jgi:hypothetical protein
VSNEPVRRYSRSFPNAGEMREFISELKKAGAKRESIQLFSSLTCLSASDRLRCNISRMMMTDVAGGDDNILVGGLLFDEKQAIMELERCRLNTRMKEIGHGLLNIHERWHARRALRQMFMEARDSGDQKLEVMEWPS